MPTITCVSNLAQLEELKSVIKSVLISEKNKDVTPAQLNNMFKELEDTDIPFKDYKFTNLVDFLRSLNDVCRLRLNNQEQLCVYYIENEKTKHISRLVSLNRDKNLKSKQKCRLNFKALQCGNTVSPHVLCNVFNKLSQKISFQRRNSISKQDVLTELTTNTGTYSFYHMENLEKQLAHYNHILNYDDDRIFFKMDKILESKRNSKANHDHSSDENGTMLFHCVSDMIREKTKIRLQELVEKYPYGIICSELPQVFCREFKLDLEYCDLGFNSILEFVVALPDILKIVKPLKCTKQVVIDARKPVNEEFLDSVKAYIDFSKKQPCEPSEERRYVLDAVPKVVSSPVSKTLIPDNFMSCGDIVNQPNVASYKDKEYIDVVVSEIFYPTLFWVTLLKYKKKINSFVKKMNDFYEQQKLEKYEITPILLQPGFNVACMYANVWYRGVITKIKDGKIVVLLYDYGTLNFYKPNELYFLEKKFSSFPAQAIPCSLYNVQPLNKLKWEKEECKAFSNKVLEKSFAARIKSFNEERNSMVVKLIAVNSFNLDISKWMVANNLAAPGNYSSPKHENTLKHYQRCLRNPSELLKECLKNETRRNNIEKPRETDSSPSTGYLSNSEKIKALNKYRTKLSNALQNSKVSSFNTEVREKKTVDEVGIVKDVEQDYSSDYYDGTSENASESALSETGASISSNDVSHKVTEHETSYASNSCSSSNYVSSVYNSANCNSTSSDLRSYTWFTPRSTASALDSDDSDDDAEHDGDRVNIRKNNNNNVVSKVVFKSCNAKILQFVESNTGCTENSQKKTVETIVNTRNSILSELHRLQKSIKKDLITRNYSSDYNTKG